jgi:hypothetical protein
MIRDLLEAFLLYFCAIGAQMTEPVETLDSPGGLSLFGPWAPRPWGSIDDRHARAEAGHHLMMIADLRSLAAHWNLRNTRLPVDADELLR